MWQAVNLDKPIRKQRPTTRTIESDQKTEIRHLSFDTIRESAMKQSNQFRHIQREIHLTTHVTSRKMHCKQY